MKRDNDQEYLYPLIPYSEEDESIGRIYKSGDCVFNTASEPINVEPPFDADSYARKFVL